MRPVTLSCRCLSVFGGEGGGEGYVVSGSLHAVPVNALGCLARQLDNNVKWSTGAKRRSALQSPIANP